MSRLRLASWNVNSLKVRLPQVLDWLESAKIDALVMQETKTTDDVFPQAAFAEAGFDVFFLGQKTYNGVALCSRQTTVKTSDVVLGLPGWPDPQKRFISALLSPLAAPEQPPIRFCGGYFPNGQAVGSSKYLYKLDWIAVLERTLKTYLADTPRLVLGGDFNIAPADADVLESGSLARKDSLLRTGAKGTRAPLCTRPLRQLQTLYAARRALFLVGLSSERFRTQSRPAH